jgi:hypothetical protein
MAEHLAPDAAAIERAQWITAEIASLAAQTDERCGLWFGELCGFGDIKFMRAKSELDALRETVCRLGWLADLAHDKLGGLMTVRGDAEAWMLPPAYHDVDREVNHD